MSLTIRLTRVVTISCAVLATVLVVGACNRGGEQYADTATGAVGSPGAPAAGTASAPPTLGDPQIAHVAVTANSIDSAAGEFARTRAQNARVKEFAQQMIRDHGAVNKQAVALATRLNMTPAENDVSRQLQQGDQQARNDLAGKRGADFDRAYIDHEIQYHQSLLDALDKTLIPGAQNADLKALLQQVRPNVAAHLQLAQQIQGTLGRQ
jgi:putative membrane protein